MEIFVTFFFSTILGTVTVRMPSAYFAERPSLEASFRYTPRVALYEPNSFGRKFFPSF